MKIAIVGTYVCDTIYTYQGDIKKSLGGISYTTSILANLLKDGDEIYPIANVGADKFDLVVGFLSQFKNVKLDGISKVKNKNTRVTLRYHNKDTREEILENVLPPIDFKQIKNIYPVDIILINFITGFELTLETRIKISQHFNAITYMDYHSLCLGIDKNGKRFQKKPTNWKTWFEGIDILQMNQDEASILVDNTSLHDFGFHVIESGVKIFNITIGANGSLLFSRQNGKSEIHQIPAYSIENVIDVTGCGDAFAGGFLTEYYKTKNEVHAAQHANYIAGLNCSISGIDQISSILKQY